MQAQKRTGWVKRGVAGPESIADHMYRMGLMAMLVQGTQYDYHRQDGVGRAGVTIKLHFSMNTLCWVLTAWCLVCLLLQVHPRLCPRNVALQSPCPSLPHLSQPRCIKLALVHDVAEAIVGDITPTCGVSDEEKFALEAGAVGRIKAMLGGAGCLPGEAALAIKCG